MSNEDQRVRITKKLIKTALFELLKEKEIQQISIKELCEKANINRGTFYNHYSSAREVLKEIEKEAMDSLLLDLCQVSFNPTSKQFLLRFFKKIQKEKELYQVLFHQCNDNPFLNGLQDAVKKTLQIQDDYLFLFMMNGNLSLIKEWINKDFDISAERFSEIVYQFNQRLLPKE